MHFATACAIITLADVTASGCGAVGSALPWGGRGRGFKSRHSDQNPATERLRDFFMLSKGFTAVFIYVILYSESYRERMNHHAHRSSLNINSKERFYD